MPANLQHSVRCKSPPDLGADMCEPSPLSGQSCALNKLAATLGASGWWCLEQGLVVSAPTHQATGGILKSLLHFSIHADQGWSQYMVSHVTMIIIQVSRHVHSGLLSAIHLSWWMDSYVGQAGRSGSTPDKGITGSAKRTWRDRRRIRNRKVLSKLYFATTRAD